MWMNLDQLPAGQSMFTVYVTDAPEGTPRDQIMTEELDVVAPSGSSADDVKAAARGQITQDYEPGVRIIGVVNASEGYVMWQAQS